MSSIIEEEKAYLKYAKEILEKEKEHYLKEMEEIPRRYTNVLQGDSFLVESLMTNAATKLKKIEKTEDKPYFGRIDFLVGKNSEAAKIYIGKTSINDGANKQVITDWRAPICSLYYDSNLGNVSYEAPEGIIEGEMQLKRQIIIKDGEIIDVLDTDTVSNDELLQPYLSVNADNRMKTIIASIQKEQNEIIRKPINKNIVVQGVAGSGKTSVALHRVAYLIYNLKEQSKTNQFLIIGPNKYFLDYISSILPELETEPVEEVTYMNLVIDTLKEKLTLDDQNVFNQKTNQELYKKIQRYKSSLEFKLLIDKFINDYLSTMIVNEGIYIDGTEIYSPDVIKNKLFTSINSHPDYDKACDYFLRDYKNRMEDIYEKLNKKYRQIYTTLPKNDPLRIESVKKSEELYVLIKEKGPKLIKDYFKKLNLSTINIYKLFIANISKYNSSLTEREILELQKSTLLSLNKRKVTFEDLPALLHINYLLKGETGKYKHIVIDEAQDYGLFHFDALKELCPNSTFSIYGDLAQAIYSYRSINDWPSVIASIFDNNCELLRLNKSYRTSIEITENANKVLEQLELEPAEPTIRHVNDVIFSNLAKDYDDKTITIKEWLAKGYKSIAIICKTDKEASKVFESLKNKDIDITKITSKDEKYNGGVFVLTSALSKGLEFDCVLINDAGENIYNSSDKLDMHLLYVAVTRALHEMNIYYDKNLCEVFSEQKQEKIKKLIK